jgi:hypothetical protein
MAEDTVTVSPAYSTYKQFGNLLNGLRETRVPSRIDRSLMGNMSGGTAYSLLSTLKFLKLTDNEGVPQPLLRQLVAAEDADRKPLIRQMLEEAYPALLGGTLNLAEASGGQFDERLREEYNVKGSTVDKVAAFFLAAAEDAGLPLSPHLKKRRPVGSASGRRRPAKKPENGGDGTVTPVQHSPKQQPHQRQLSHVLTDLLDVTDMSDAEMEAVWVLLRYQKRKEAAALAAAAQETQKQ